MAMTVRSSTHWTVVLLGASLGAACTGALGAEDEPLEGASAAIEGPAGAGRNDAPRLTRTDVQTEPQRSLPGYRNELTELSYRWWVSTGRADVGVGLGAIAFVARPTGSLQGLNGDGAALALASRTVLTVGMRYRTVGGSALFADAAGVRGLGLDRGDAVVSKVGVEFKAAQSLWNLNYGGLGLRLAGDTRMTLRLRKGGFGVSMRRSF